MEDLYPGIHIRWLISGAHIQGLISGDLFPGLISEGPGYKPPDIKPGA